ncbi:enoyl-CoA hydratase/isomerase family protein [Sphingomonas sp.]|uniref:enoyl-CoA hydratase/isomerase family protein n=1 Tax=Sphingomonas sp. TaxID=28214 RepID=UPI002DD694F5|nr:enoyl-CoA hydratase/isomerase family protein [Sphingomonas sp.]
MIVTRRAGAIVTIALDRPAARNALSTAGWNALAGAVGAVAASDAAAVILGSAVPGIFSAGADLADLAILGEDVPGRAAFRARMAAAIEGIAALPMPVIAAIDGGCYGAAVALALACDIVVAGDRAVFATTPAKLGIGYPGGDVARLADRVGRGQAARMLFAAQPIDADEAARIGLAHLRAAEAVPTAEALAAQVAANAPGAVRLLKRTIADPGNADAGFDAAFGGTEFVERLAVFRNRTR